MSRLESFRQMVARTPNNPLARYGLANEAMKVESYEEAVENYRAYLAIADDEGHAFGQLADALARLGRVDEARSAFQQGIEASRRFGHPGMASELESRLEELEEDR